MRDRESIKQEKDCIECELGEHRQRMNAAEADKRKHRWCIGGAGPEDLTKVRLIVISDHPGHYETMYGMPMLDITKHRPERNTKTGLLNPNNGGGFLRQALEMMYGLDTYKEVWITNAVKCNPDHYKILESKHLKPCLSKWLGPELQVLDSINNTLPILIAGQYAYRALKMLYKNNQIANLGYMNCRRRSDLRVDSHPVVFTENPAKAARSEPRIETEIYLSNERWVPRSNDWLYPPLPGSPVYSFIEDLRFLGEFLNESSKEV